MTFHWLDDATLHAVWKAAIHLGLSREAVLPKSVAAMVPTSPRPVDQLLLDLRYLNDIEALTDGSVPLRTWLETAWLIHGVRREAAPFQLAIEKLSLRDEKSNEKGGESVPFGRDRPPLPNSPGRLWEAPSVAALWQHPDSQKLVEVMKRYSSVRELRDIAQQAGFDASRVDWQQPLALAARELVGKSFRSNQLEAIIEKMCTDIAIARWHGDLQAILDR